MHSACKCKHVSKYSKCENILPYFFPFKLSTNVVTSLQRGCLAISWSTAQEIIQTDAVCDFVGNGFIRPTEEYNSLWKKSNPTLSSRIVTKETVLGRIWPWTLVMEVTQAIQCHIYYKFVHILPRQHCAFFIRYYNMLCQLLPDRRGGRPESSLSLRSHGGRTPPPPGPGKGESLRRTLGE